MLSKSFETLEWVTHIIWITNSLSRITKSGKDVENKTSCQATYKPTRLFINNLILNVYRIANKLVGKDYFAVTVFLLINTVFYVSKNNQWPSCYCSKRSDLKSHFSTLSINYELLAFARDFARVEFPISIMCVLPTP